MPSFSTAVRHAPLDIDPNVFRRAGHILVDRVADLLQELPQMPLTPGETPSQVRGILGEGPLPTRGEPIEALLEDTTRMLIEHSLFNGHPRFLGFITSSAAPVGALADLLAAAINPNLGGWLLSPIASEIESQTVRWIAELVGYPSDCGGLLVSGGNMANFVGFWAARRAKGGAAVRSNGVGMSRMRAYASSETHTWIEKAADLSGLGTTSVRLVDTDAQQRMDVTALRSAIEEDIAAGDVPFMVVGTAGTVSTGAMDPLRELAAISSEFQLWFHVDGAYGAPAAVLEDAHPDLAAMHAADSVAIDPHKWLYAPLEAGCVLVKSNERLRDTFSYHPPYYPDEDPHGGEHGLMYHELGPQNSRGFRALKVWLALRQVGRDGYRKMIAEDIRLARRLYDAADMHPELYAVTCELSIATFQYVPVGVDPHDSDSMPFLNDLNKRLLVELQRGGEVFLSNAVVDGRYVLRGCIVNFRTSEPDVLAIPEIVVRVGRALAGGDG